MEWKEKGVEVIFVGTITFLGSYFVKVYKKNISPLKKLIESLKRYPEMYEETHLTTETLKAVIHLSPLAQYILNAEGELEYVNPKWCELLGFNDPEDAYGMGWVRAIPDRNVDKTLKQNEQHIKHPGNYQSTFLFRRISDGVEIETNVRATVIRSNDGKRVLKTIGIVIPVEKVTS